MTGDPVVIPAEVAEWFVYRLGLHEIRVGQMGVLNRETYKALVDLTIAAHEYRAMKSGTISARKAVPAGELLSTTSAAALIGITKRAVRKAITQQRLSATRVGGHWRIARADVEQFRADRKG